MTAKPPSPASTVRDLDDSDLDDIVGGASTLAARRELTGLIAEDLVGHDTGHDRTDDIAKMIVSGAVTATEAFQKIESNAVRDGKHSTDEQLADVRDDLTRMHATSAAATFNAEQGRRLLSGEAGAELGGLMRRGLMTGAEAVAVLKHADTPTRSGGLDDALMALEKAGGGDSAVEVALGQLMKTHQAKAADVVAAVKAGAAAGHDSVDMALTRVNAAALGDATVQAEMRRRVVSGEAAADFADAIRHGSATEQDAIKTLAAEVAKGIVTDPYRVRALTAIERAGAGDAGIETLLGQYARAGKLSAAAAIAAAKAGAAVAHDSYDEALGRLRAGSGHNATIEAEQRARTVSGATAADLVSAISHGMMTDGEAAAVLAAKVANGAITQTQQAWDLLKIERTGVADVAIETALGQLVMAHKLSPAAAIAAVTQGATRMGESVDVALLRLRAPTCTQEVVDNGPGFPPTTYTYGDPKIEEAIRNRMNSGAMATDLVARLDAGTMTGKEITDLLATTNDFGYGGQPRGTLLRIICQRPGDPDIEGMLARICSNIGADAGVIGALTSAETASHGSVDALLMRLDDIAGSYTADFKVAERQRLLDGSTSAALVSEVQSGRMSFDDAAALISRASQSFNFFDSADGIAATKLGALAAVSRALGHPAEFDTVLAQWVDGGEITGDQAISVDGGPSDIASLFKLDMNVHGGSPAVEARIANNLLSEVSMKGFASHADMVDKIVKAGIQHATDAGCIGNDVLAKVLEAMPAIMTRYGVSKLELLTVAAKQWMEPSLTQAIQASLLGDGVEELAKTISRNRPWMTAQLVFDTASAAVAQVQKMGADLGAPPLNGLIESSYVLAKLSDAVSEMSHAGQSSTELVALGGKLTSNYAMAVAIGSAAAPLVDALGVENANIALAAGQKLASIADPTTGEEAKTIVDLETTMRAKGVSVDAALALASFQAGGRSEVLKLEMTDRLLSGKAETDLGLLAADGRIGLDEPAAVLKSAVSALAAGSPTGTALGYDRDTATALVTAKLYMQLKTLSDAPATAQYAYGLRYVAMHLEDTDARSILVGCGALLGRLQGGATPAEQMANAVDPTSLAAINQIQSITTALLNKSIVQQMVEGAATTDPAAAKAKLQTITEDTVQDFSDAYGKASQLAKFEKDFLEGKKPDATATDAEKKLQHDFSASLQTYKFTEFGTAIGVDASTTAQLGNGFSVTFDAGASAGAGVEVDATQVTVKAAAQASASETWDLGGHARVVMLAQAIASGSVTAGVTGVAVKGNVAVGESITIDQTEQGSLGNGFDGMQTTTLKAGLVASADGSAAIGIKNEANFGARIGAYASAGEAGEISYGGVTVGGGATIMSPGVVGYSTDVSVDFSGGDIKIGVDQFIGAELFGAEFKFDLTLPTGQIISALKNLGGTFEDVGKAIAGGLEQFGGDFVDGLNSAKNWAEQNLNPFNW